MLRLTEARVRRGWSQRTLAYLAKRYQPEPCLIEQDRFTPTPDELEEPRRAVGITPGHVLLRPVVVRDPEEEAEPSAEAAR